jgi:membrane associated rhomboid family serine protease
VDAPTRLDGRAPVRIYPAAQMRKLRNTLKRLEWQTNGYFPPLVFLLSVLIAILYLIDAFLGLGGNRVIIETLAMRPAEVWSGSVWQLVTAGFIHLRMIDLLFELLIFGLFARHLHRRFGAWVFFWQMMASLVIGFLIQSLLWNMPGYGFTPATHCCVFAFVAIAPAALFFGFIPAWIVGLIIFLIDLAGVFGEYSSASWIANLWGAGLGIAVIRWPWLFRWGRWFQRFSDRLTAGYERRREAAREKEEAHLDELLAKVSAGGLPALSEAERRFLTRYNQKHKKKASDD